MPTKELTKQTVCLRGGVSSSYGGNATNNNCAPRTIFKSERRERFLHIIRTEPSSMDEKIGLINADYRNFSRLISEGLKIAKRAQAQELIDWFRKARRDINSEGEYINRILRYHAKGTPLHTGAEYVQGTYDDFERFFNRGLGLAGNSVASGDIGATKMIDWFKQKLKELNVEETSLHDILRKTSPTPCIK